MNRADVEIAVYNSILAIKAMLGLSSEALHWHSSGVEWNSTGDVCSKKDVLRLGCVEITVQAMGNGSGVEGEAFIHINGIRAQLVTFAMTSLIESDISQRSRQ